MWGRSPHKGGLSVQVVLCAYIGGCQGISAAFYSPQPKPPVPTCGPPRLSGGFKGLSCVNISNVVAFLPFLGDF